MEFVPSPEGRGEWTHLQSSGGHCRDGSCSEDGDVCSIEKPRAGGPEHPDHILCRRRFAVPAGVDVFSFPIWNPIVFQSIVQRFSVYVSRPSRPDRRGWKPQQPCITLPHFLRKGNSVFELDYPFSISQVEPGLGHKKIYPSRWSSLHRGFAAGSLQYRSPILETTMRGQDLSSSSPYMGVVGLAGAA